MLASLAPELDADRIIGHVCMLCEEALGYRPYALITCASSLRSWCRPARPPTAPSRGAPRPTTHSLWPALVRSPNPPTGPSTSNRPLACAAPGAGHGRPDTSHLTTDPT